jgi:tetratricopeptide (TPR) repeat protein
MDDGGALARVEALVQLGRCSEAESMLARVLADHPDDHRAWCLLALARDGLSHWSEVLQAANHAVAVAPDHEWGHRLASIALARLEMTEAAVRAATEAVRLDPHGWRTHLQYSLVAARVPRLVQDAYRAAGRAAEIAPHSSDAHFALGFSSDATGRHEEVAGHCREALRLNPQHVNALNNLTNLERGTRLGAKAAGYARALRLDPSAAVPRENLELMAGQFLLHVTGLAAVALLACAVIGAADDLRPGFSVAASPSACCWSWPSAATRPGSCGRCRTAPCDTCAPGRSDRACARTSSSPRCACSPPLPPPSPPGVRPWPSPRCARWGCSRSWSASRSPSVTAPDPPGFS